jgi:hypothetical protein
MNIVTGYRGVPHVTSQQDRYINQSAYGLGSYVLPIGNQMSATIDSATQVTISDGGVSVQGCVGVIEYGQSESLAIESGTTGMQRHDLIVARYTKDTSGVEDIQLVVLTGVPTTGTAEDPAYTDGSIAAGDTIVDFPIWRVNINGIAIESVTRVGSIGETLATLAQKYQQITSAVTIGANNVVHFRNLQGGATAAVNHPSGGGTVITPVTFTTPFTVTPYVVATVLTANPQENSVSVQDITTTGFKIVTYRSTAGSLSVRWLAFR